jgi:hypothetical protein
MMVRQWIVCPRLSVVTDTFSVVLFIGVFCPCLLYLSQLTCDFFQSVNVPAVVFESENILTNVGGSAASKAIEQKLQNYLNKVGFTSGKVKITFNEDKSGSIQFANKNIPFQWSVADTDLTINLASTAFSQLTSSTKLGKLTTFKVNCKMTSDGMQLAFKADKLAQFLSKVLSAVGSATNNTTLTTLTAATKSINGMYLGLTFVK